MNYNPSWGGNRGGGRGPRGRGRGWRGNPGGSHRGRPPLFRGIPPGLHGRLDGHRNSPRGGGYRGPPTDSFNQSYPPNMHTNEPSWTQVRNRPLFSTLPDFSSGPLQRRPFLSPPRSMQSPVRPTSPLPGSEEYMQRDISEKSAFLKRELKLEGSSTDFIINSSKFETFTSDFISDSTSSNFCDIPFRHNKNIDLHDVQNESKPVQQVLTEKVPSPRRNKRPVQKPTLQRVLSVGEIHDRIMNHISNLSLGKKMNLVNQARTTGYDIAIQQITRQKRLALSKALRDMCNNMFKETESSSDVINAIIPDFDIKIEELPRELVAQLSSTLNEDVEERIQTMSVDPELMFQQAADMLNISLDGDVKADASVNEDLLDEEFNYSFQNLGECSETGSDSNMSQNIKEPIRNFTPPSSHSHHNCSNMSFGETTSSPNAMNVPIPVPQPCQSSPMNFSSLPPINFTIPPLMDFVIPSLASAGQQENIKTPPCGKRGNDSPIFAERTFTNVQYYSPGHESSDSNSFQGTPGCSDSKISQNIIKDNVTTLPLNVPAVGDVLTKCHNSQLSIMTEDQESKKHIDLYAGVDNILMPPSEPPFGLISAQNSLLENLKPQTEQCFKTNLNKVDDTVKTSMQIKTNEAIILSDIALPPLQDKIKIEDSGHVSDVLTEAAELEACLAQSDAELKLLEFNKSAKVSFTIDTTSTFLKCKVPKLDDEKEEITAETSTETPNPEPVKKIKLRRSPLRKQIADDKKQEHVNTKTNEEQPKNIRDKPSEKELAKKKSEPVKKVDTAKKPIKLNRSFGYRTDQNKTTVSTPPRQDKTKAQHNEQVAIKQQQVGEQNRGAYLPKEESENAETDKIPQKSISNTAKAVEQVPEKLIPEKLSTTTVQTNKPSKSKEKYPEGNNKTKSRSRSSEKDTISPDKKLGHKEKVKQKPCAEEETVEKKRDKKSSAKYVEVEELSKSDHYNKSKCERSRYDIFQAQKCEEEYRKKYKERVDVDEERYRRFDRDTSYERVRDLFRSSDSEHSETYRYSKYHSEREDLRHSKRYYHEKATYGYRPEYTEFTKDYPYNSQKHAYSPEYHSRQESSYLPEEYEQKSSHHNQNHKSKHEKLHKKRSKKHKRHRDTSFSSTGSSAASSGKESSTSSNHRKLRHRTKHSDLPDSSEDRTVTKNLKKPLKERIQMLYESKNMSRCRDSSSDYDENRKIKSEPVSPEVSKAPSPERSKSMDRFNKKITDDLNVTKDSLGKVEASNASTPSSSSTKHLTSPVGIVTNKTCPAKGQIEKPKKNEDIMRTRGKISFKDQPSSSNKKMVQDDLELEKKQQVQANKHGNPARITSNLLTSEETKENPKGKTEVVKEKKLEVQPKETPNRITSNLLTSEETKENPKGKTKVVKERKQEVQPNEPPNKHGNPVRITSNLLTSEETKENPKGKTEVVKEKKLEVQPKETPNRITSNLLTSEETKENPKGKTEVVKEKKQQVHPNEPPKKHGDPVTSNLLTSEEPKENPIGKTEVVEEKKREVQPVRITSNLLASEETKEKPKGKTKVVKEKKQEVQPKEPLNEHGNPVRITSNFLTSEETKENPKGKTEVVKEKKQEVHPNEPPNKHGDPVTSNLLTSEETKENPIGKTEVVEEKKREVQPVRITSNLLASEETKEKPKGKTKVVKEKKQEVQPKEPPNEHGNPVRITSNLLTSEETRENTKGETEVVKEKKQEVQPVRITSNLLTSEETKENPKGETEVVKEKKQEVQPVRITSNLLTSEETKENPIGKTEVVEEKKQEVQPVRITSNLLASEETKEKPKGKTKLVKEKKQEVQPKEPPNEHGNPVRITSNLLTSDETKENPIGKTEVVEEKKQEVQPVRITSNLLTSEETKEKPKGKTKVVKEKKQEVQPKEPPNKHGNPVRITSNLSTSEKTKENRKGKTEIVKESQPVVLDKNNKETKTLPQEESDLKKCNQRPWKSPGEKKFMNEHLSIYPGHGEEPDYEASDTEPVPAYKTNSSFLKDSPNVANECTNILSGNELNTTDEAPHKEKLPYLKPESSAIEALPVTMNVESTINENNEIKSLLVPPSGSSTFVDTDKSITSINANSEEIEMDLGSPAKIHSVPQKIVNNQDMQNENAQTIETHKNMEVFSNTMKGSVGEKDPKLLEDVSEEINSTSEIPMTKLEDSNPAEVESECAELAIKLTTNQKNSTIIEPKSAELLTESNKNNAEAADKKSLELLTSTESAESTSGVVEYQDSIKIPSLKSNSQETRTESNQTNTSDSKNSRSKSRSSVSPSEVLHSAEVSSTSDTAKLAAHSKRVLRSRSKSKGKNPIVLQPIEEPKLFKNEEITRATDTTDEKEAKLGDVAIGGKKMLVTTYTQTQLDETEHKRSSHKKSTKDVRKDKKHSSLPKSDSKFNSSIYTQTYVACTNNFTQTPIAKSKNIQVQLECDENTTTLKKSVFSQTDPIVIIDTTDDTEALDKFESSDKTNRKILKAVYRKKTIQRMFDLDKEIERLTKLRQKMYKQLNFDSDSDENELESSVAKSNRDRSRKHAGTARTEKYKRGTHKEKPSTSKKSNVGVGSKSGETHEKAEIKSNVDDNQNIRSSDRKSTKLRTSKRSLQSCSAEPVNTTNTSAPEEYTKKAVVNGENLKSSDANPETSNLEASSSDRNKNAGTLDEDEKQSDKTRLETSSELSNTEKCEYEVKMNINEENRHTHTLRIHKKGANVKESNRTEETKAVLKIKPKNMSINEEEEQSTHSEPESINRPTRSKNKILSMETKKQQRKADTGDKREQSSGRDTSSEQTAVHEHIKTKRRQHGQVEVKNKPNDSSGRETSAEPSLEHRTKHKKKKRQKTPNLEHSFNEKDTKSEENKRTKSKKKSHGRKSSKRSKEERTEIKIKIKLPVADCEQRFEESSAKLIETDSPPSKRRKRTLLESPGSVRSNVSNEESKKLLGDHSETTMITQSETYIKPVTAPKLCKQEKTPENDGDTKNKAKRSKSVSQPRRNSKELQEFGDSAEGSSKTDLGVDEDEAEQKQESEHQTLLGFQRLAKLGKATKLTSEIVEENEVADNLNGNITESITEQVQFQKQRKKRRKMDAVELDPAIDSQNLSTKIPKSMSTVVLETHCDAHPGTHKKKPSKRYPFSGIKSNYKSRKRKSSTETNIKRKLSTEAVEEKSPNFGCVSSVVKITRYTLTQLEKMRESIRNKSSNIPEIDSGISEKSELTEDVDIKEPEINLTIAPPEFNDFQENEAFKSPSDVHLETMPPPQPCVLPTDSCESEVIKEEINIKEETLSIKNVEFAPEDETSTSGNLSLHVETTDEAFANVDKEHVQESKNSKSLVEPPSVSPRDEEADESKIEDCEFLEIVDEEDEYKMDFKGFNGAILVIKVIASTALAASDKGKVFCFSMLNGELINTFDMSKLAITSMVIIKRSESNIVYTGSLDSCISVLNFDSKEVLKHEKLVEPVQCMENAWNYIFIGSDRGSLIRFDLNTEKVADVIKISDFNVLMMKATQEGPRKVLVIATRNAPVSVRDASSGLLLRTMATPFSPTVYTLLFDRNLIYCGTSQHDILVYTFEDGQLVFKHEATKSKGVVCMQIVGSLLFAGCYNGNIYVYNTKTNVHLGTMNGPGGLMLSMEIVRNKIIVGTKSSNFKAWRIPQKYLDQM